MKIRYTLLAIILAAGTGYNLVLYRMDANAKCAQIDLVHEYCEPTAYGLQLCTIETIRE